MPNLGPTELIIVAIMVAIYAMPVVAWIYLFRQGGEARDLIFWSIIIFVVPVLGSIAVFLFYRRRDKDKHN